MILQNRKKTLFTGLAVVVSAAVIFLILTLPPGAPLHQWMNRQRFGVRPGVTLAGEDMSRMLDGEVWQFIQQMAGEPRHSVNAYYEKELDAVFPQKAGKTIDVYQTYIRVMEAENNQAVTPAYRFLDAEVPAEALMGLDELIGSYRTWIGGRYTRVENIDLAAQFINGTVLAPGEVFSFNNTVGPQTLERGFKLAPILIGGGAAMGPGGGVCQVSSTIYNAVLEAELEVVERHPHSRPVNYVPRGRDATVSTALDFKFRNSTNQYIKLVTYVTGGGMFAEIYGVGATR